MRRNKSKTGRSSTLGTAVRSETTYSRPGGRDCPEDERGASREAKLKDNGVAGEAWDKRARVSQELQTPKRQKQAKSADTTVCREAALFRQARRHRAQDGRDVTQRCPGAPLLLPCVPHLEQETGLGSKQEKWGEKCEAKTFWGRADFILCF